MDCHRRRSLERLCQHCCGTHSLRSIPCSLLDNIQSSAEKKNVHTNRWVRHFSGLHRRTDRRSLVAYLYERETCVASEQAIVRLHTITQDIVGFGEIMEFAQRYMIIGVFRRMKFQS